MLLGKLCGGGNLAFIDGCMDSSLGFASSIPSRQNKSRIRIHLARFIMTYKRLISSILIRLVL